MKLKAFFAVAAIAMLAACSTSYRATDVNNPKVVVVSDNLRTSFASQYPNASDAVWMNYDPNVVILNDWELADWSAMDASDYVVRFNMDNENYYAWYDKDGTWVGSAYVIKDYNTLPAAINSTLTSQFPGYSITSVNREFKKDRAAYEIVLKNNDSKVVALVDMQGNIIKQKTKSK